MKTPHKCIRVTIVILACCSYALAIFHRYSTSSLIQQLATTLKVSTDDISLFSSMFFWPYAIVQPIGGLLADIIEPGILICCSSLISSIGSLTIGLSTNYYVSCVARCLIGLGCGPTFVPFSRVLANWFSPGQFSILSGVLMSCGSIGGMIGQGPCASIAKVIHWQWIFIVAALTGVTLAILSAIFVRQSEYQITEPSQKTSRLPLLVSNIKSVTSKVNFWKLIVWSSTCTPTFYVTTGFWGVEYIVSTFGVSNEYASYMVMMLSLSTIVGSPLMTAISGLLKTRKKILIVGSSIGICTCLTFMFLTTKTPIWVIWMVLFIYGFACSATIGVAVTMYKEMVDAASAATALGLANFFPSIATTIIQIVEAKIMERIDSGSTLTHHTHKAFELGYWMVNAICCAASLLGVCIVNDTISKGSPDPLESTLTDEAAVKTDE